MPINLKDMKMPSKSEAPAEELDLFADESLEESDESGVDLASVSDDDLIAELQARDLIDVDEEGYEEDMEMDEEIDPLEM